MHEICLEAESEQDKEQATAGCSPFDQKAGKVEQEQGKLIDLMWCKIIF